MSRNHRYFTCHRYDIDISKKTISKAPIRYDIDIIDIGDISRYFRYIDTSLIQTHCARSWWFNVFSSRFCLFRASRKSFSRYATHIYSETALRIYTHCTPSVCPAWARNPRVKGRRQFKFGAHRIPCLNCNFLCHLDVKSVKSEVSWSSNTTYAIIDEWWNDHRTSTKYCPAHECHTLRTFMFKNSKNNVTK